MTASREWYYEHVRPRMLYFPWVITWLILFPLGWFRRRKRPPVLCIEAGARGWDSIEFKELYQSACEYLGPRQVHRLVVDRNLPYVSQVVDALNDTRPTHYVYDARTGSQSAGRGLLQSFQVAFILHIRGITPIVLLTDLAVRAWRTQSAVVTARRGVVVSFISAREIAGIFPHRRLVAPSLMPLSRRTSEHIDLLRVDGAEKPQAKAVFIGSMYEPRTTVLQRISDGLSRHGFELEVRGRVLGSARVSDQDYWAALVNAALIVTTADQLSTDATDWTWIPHLVYRYIEVTAAGTLLVAPAVPGVRRYFEPGVHFVEFESAEDAIEKIAFYLANPVERDAIARRGRNRARALLEGSTFWTCIDAALGPDSIH